MTEVTVLENELVQDLFALLILRLCSIQRKWLLSLIVNEGSGFRTSEIYLSARRLRPHNPDQFGKFAIAETCI